MANEYNNLQNAKRSSIGNKFFVFVLIFLGFISGVVVGFIVNGSLKSDVDSSLLLREKGYEFISPLIDVEPREMSTLKKINDLEVKLNVLVTNLTTDTETYKAKSISVYYKELSSGAWIGINEKEQFAPASLLKVPLMIAYYKLAESNPSILNKKIKYKQIDNDFTQNVQPSLTLKNNMDYTLDEVINSMIIESDNQAMFFNTID